MHVIKHWAFLPLLLLVLLWPASALTTPGRWSVSLVLVWVALTVPAAMFIERRRVRRGWYG